MYEVTAFCTNCGRCNILTGSLLFSSLKVFCLHPQQSRRQYTVAYSRGAGSPITTKYPISYSTTSRTVEGLEVLFESAVLLRPAPVEYIDSYPRGNKISYIFLEPGLLHFENTRVVQQILGYFWKNNINVLSTSSQLNGKFENRPESAGRGCPITTLKPMLAFVILVYVRTLQ